MRWNDSKQRMTPAAVVTAIPTIMQNELKRQISIWNSSDPDCAVKFQVTLPET